MTDETSNLEALKRQALEKFTPDEIQKFITVGKQLAGKSVLTALIEVIKGQTDGIDGTADQLVKEVTALIPYKYAGFVQCDFNGVPFRLNISLSIVPRDYKTNISVPDAGYAKDLYSKYDFLKNTAVAYWRQFVEENPDLFNRICDHCSDLDLSTLIVDKENPTTLYFDPQSSKRVGIFCYYVDQHGRPIRK